jgi:hypothetical protein
VSPSLHPPPFKVHRQHTPKRTIHAHACTMVRPAFSPTPHPHAHRATRCRC